MCIITFFKISGFGGLVGCRSQVYSFLELLTYGKQTLFVYQLHSLFVSLREKSEINIA